MPTAAETAGKLFANRQNLAAIGNYSEADTVNNLINPVLDFLGYPDTHQRREHQHGGNRPDIIMWDLPAGKASSKPAAAVLEAKPLGHDLEGKGKPRSQRPKNQQRRYLNGHPASQPGTYGFLTDGNIWHTVRKHENEQIRLVKEWRLLDETTEACAAYLQEIKEMLAGDTPALAPQAAPHRTNQKARAICAAIAAGAAPAAILRMLAGATGRGDISNDVNLSAQAGQAEREYWQQHAYAEAGRIKTEQKDTTQEAICVAVVQAANADNEDDAILHRADVAIAASAFAKVVPAKTSVTLMIQPDEKGEPAAARLAVHHQGHTGMTAEFNPHTPSPKTLRIIQSICEQLNKKQPVAASALVDAVAAKGLRREFYQKIAEGWTLRQYRKATGNATQQQIYREAVLRHLIRTTFAWILKEDGKLPPEAFDEAFAKREGNGDYHNEILAFLFHERLNQPDNARRAHHNPAIEQALASTRFLNGSLFARHPGDQALKLADEDYFSADPEKPGLFTILGEYEWTASEHTPHSSDQTIDPEALSNLFENLVAATKYGGATPDRMPAGTYYTPADVALEMVKDALAEAVIDQSPQHWTRDDLRALFGDEDAERPASSGADTARLVQRIRELTIYDPAVGSGEFPFTVTLAVRLALRKLGVPDDNASVTRDIVARQLFAQDINPMAVQVARLRLFIAIIAAENAADAAATPPPLPNLEAKIVCADTLATVADPKWTPFGSGTLQAIMPQVNQALDQVASIREKWQSAHDEPSKLALRQQDEVARQALRATIRGRIANPETIAFADHPLLDPDAPPANIDPRLLFYHRRRQGFDIVIGNPPYESVNKDLQTPPNASRAVKKKLKQQRQARKRHLTNQKHYRTTAGNDLYNLVAEAGLTLAKPEGGVVTLITPLSLCFGQDQQELRRLFEERCRRISLRCQDNRPDKVFHDSPVVHAESRVRTAIITATTGEGAPAIELSDTNRWRKSERREYLTSRPSPVVRAAATSIDRRIDGQWERLPTPEIQRLITAMRAEPAKIRDWQQAGENECALAFPPTAMYFITATPGGSLNRGENQLPIANQEKLELAIAAANTHAAYAWWKAFGDAFHINPHEMATIAIPQAYIEDGDTNRRARQLAGQLIDAINPGNIRRITTGTRGRVQDSLNFHECAAGVIAALDAMYLDALGLPRQPLLTQLHTLRSDSTWQLGADRQQNLLSVWQSTVHHDTAVSATILEKVEDIARNLLYERFPNDFVFDPIIVEPKIDHEGVEYLQLYIVYDGEYAKLDPLWTASLGLKMEPALLELGITELPSKAYIEKSEWEAGPPA